MENSRRQFLSGAILLGTAPLTGCTRDRSIGQPILGDAGTGGESRALEERLETLGFLEEDRAYGVATGAGWDGRLYTDLSKLEPDQLVTENDNFYVRTRYPDQLDPSAPWSLRIGGLVSQDLTLSVEDVEAVAVDQGLHLLECAGNFRGGGFGLMSVAGWTGAPLLDLARRVTPDPGASRILVSGFDGHSVPSANMHSTPGASWIFSPEDLEQTGAFLATHMNGEPLPPDHGYPLRLVVPGWYGCTCIKWVDEISWVADDVAATSQMIEFASRTHQTAEHPLARQYTPAAIDQAAMPVRVEKWSTASGIAYRVVGIAWGGARPAQTIEISFDEGVSFDEVEPLAPITQNAHWSMWSYLWQPPAAGTYSILCRADAGVAMLRLDRAYYLREVRIDDV